MPGAEDTQFLLRRDADMFHFFVGAIGPGRASYGRKGSAVTLSCIPFFRRTLKPTQMVFLQNLPRGVSKLLLAYSRDCEVARITDPKVNFALLPDLQLGREG